MLLCYFTTKLSAFSTPEKSLKRARIFCIRNEIFKKTSSPYRTPTRHLWAKSFKTKNPKTFTTPNNHSYTYSPSAPNLNNDLNNDVLLYNLVSNIFEADAFFKFIDKKEKKTTDNTRTIITW